MIQNRKSASLIGRATRPVVEFLEQRQLLSATLSVSSSLMVFNAVENSSSSQTETLTLTNSGDAALTLGSGSATLVADPSASSDDHSRFSILNGSSIPATLAPGASFGLQLDYTATSVTTDEALLDIASSDPNTPTQISLHGIGTKGLGGTNQPSLATVLQAYNIPTLVGDGPDDDDALQDNTYPYPPDPSSQEVVLQRLVKAGSGPVTIDVLASFTASGTHPFTLGTYSSGNPNSLNELFTTPSSEYQSVYVQPDGATSFDPGSNTFGFYFISNVQVTGRVGYEEDAFNTWDTTTGRHFRFFPMETANGTAVPNEYIMTSTEWDAPVGYDFTNIVAIISNVKAAPNNTSEPAIGLQNKNAVVGSNTMVFNRIASPNTIYPNVVHNTGVLQVNNTGDSPLIISSYSLTSGYALVSPPTFPLTIAAGGDEQLTIQFNVNGEPSVPYNETNGTDATGGGGVYDGTLTLFSNDPVTPAATQRLAGWYQYHSENENEPSLQSITNLLFGWGTDINPTPIADLTESSSTSGSSPTYYGQEVVSDFWSEADTSTSVGITQIAGYHTEGNIATTDWYTQGSSTYNTLFVTGIDDGQTLFPLTNTSTPAIATATFSSTGNFGFRVDNEYSNDAQNTVLMTGGGHHFRFYPIVDEVTGKIIPNDYIMAQDYSNTPQNFDFQDNVWIVTNIKPVDVMSNVSSPVTTGGGPAMPTSFYATTGSNGNLLEWGSATSSGIAGYDVYRATTAAGPYTLLTTTPITTLTYTDTAAPASGVAYYEVTALATSSLDQSVPATAFLNSSAGTVVTNPTGTPIAAGGIFNTSAGLAVTINELANATDATGTLIPASVVVSTQPVDGTTAINASNGAITYTPNTGFNGTDTFQYTVSDSTGAVSSPATITVNVIAGPVGTPIVANLSETVSYDTPLAINVVSSATDSTATLYPNTVAIAEAPAHGTATVDPTTGNITYTPATGYTGADTFLYTISDSLLAVSQPGTITITVGAAPPVLPTPAGATIIAPGILESGTETVSVISSATDPNGTLNPASLAITTLPTNGTASVNSSAGTITYTPNASFVGTDSLTYTVADVDGIVSAPATLSFTVGLAINNTTDKLLTFTDSNGSKVRVTLTGGGSGLIYFNGSGTAITTAGPRGTGTIAVSGPGLSISGLDITGSTMTGALSITRTGTSAMVSLANVSITGELGRLIAPTSELTGTFSVTGAVTTMQIGSADNATITIGSTGATRSGLTITAGSVTNTSVTSGTPIRTLRATQWLESGTTDAITAPSITSLVTTTGNFEAGITATGGSPYSLQSVSIRGQISDDPWTVTGNTANIVAGSVAAGWSGDFTGSINTFTVRAGGFSGTLTAGAINAISIVGNDTGGINAASVRSARIVGQLNGGYLIVTNAVAARAYSLGRLTVTGAMIDSKVVSAGNVGPITAAGISSSSIDAGVNNGITLPTSAGDFAQTATITSVAVTGRGSTFADSDIAAATLGVLSLGEIITASSTTPFGVSADTIRSMSLTLDTGGGLLRLSAATLATSSSVTNYFAANNLTPNQFEINTGL